MRNVQFHDAGLVDTRGTIYGTFRNDKVFAGGAPKVQLLLRQPGLKTMFPNVIANLAPRQGFGKELRKNHENSDHALDALRCHGRPLEIPRSTIQFIPETGRAGLFACMTRLRRSGVILANEAYEMLDKFTSANSSTLAKNVLNTIFNSTCYRHS
ncbi:hypothetical protein BV898_19367 [Hypsibius exemplaris]|uniref:Uncharacterized protein n=1 Tax=Hypsibius exemplaris TaxID=2072580 RepID=A0A9X6RPJ0_HYPEX|nr:hypothetical protein BV898_19367 [Hypsibius exemplaris]